MTTCIIENCENDASNGRGHKYCRSCYFKRRNSNRRRRRQKGYFRMIVHEDCSSSGNPTPASHSKICGVCVNPTEEGTNIVFQTICSDCAKLKPHGSLIARTESPEFNDFCVDCKAIIPGSSKPQKSQIRDDENISIEQSEQSSSVTLKMMVTDLSRVLNGVTKIKRNTLLNRLIKECGYTNRDASIAVSSVLGLYSYSEEDGMIIFNS